MSERPLKDTKRTRSAPYVSAVVDHATIIGSEFRRRRGLRETIVGLHDCQNGTNCKIIILCPVWRLGSPRLVYLSYNSNRVLDTEFRRIMPTFARAMGIRIGNG
jgi:hypothetical protein